MANKNDHIKRLEPSWKTGMGMRRAEGGDHRHWKQRFMALTEALVGDIMQSSGMGEEEAREMVAEHLIGLRQPTSGAASLAISPEAQGMLHTEEKPAGWKSAHELICKHKGYRDWHARMEALAERLAGDIVDSTQVNIYEARDLVKNHLIGLRRPHRGATTICASGDAERLLLEEMNHRRNGKGGRG